MAFAKGIALCVAQPENQFLRISTEGPRGIPDLGGKGVAEIEIFWPFEMRDAAFRNLSGDDAVIAYP